MLLAVWFVLIFVLGAAVGSFLNVCIYRLPLEKSILWPGSRCGRCLKPIRRYDNLPLLSYWLLRGRCRMCGAKFSLQYFLVELLTACAFVGLFYLEIVENIHHFGVLQHEAWAIRLGIIPWPAWVVFGQHALLLSLLIVAAFCDLMHREIPLAVTVPGTLLGLIGAVLWPWPWPGTVADAVRVLQRYPGPPAWAWRSPGFVVEGLYPWPFWGPLPDWFAPGGNWQTGLATGLAGALFGTFLLRGVRFVFSSGIGKEALGMGDADLMMMAGAFLGWQPVLIAFFVAVVPGLVFGVGGMVLNRDNMVAFGPSLAIGVVATWLLWPWIGPFAQVLLFDQTLMLVLGGLCAVFLFLSSLVIRLLHALKR